MGDGGPPALTQTKTLQYNVAASGSSAGAADMTQGAGSRQEEPQRQPVGTVVNPDDYEPGRAAKTLGGERRRGEEWRGNWECEVG